MFGIDGDLVIDGDIESNTADDVDVFGDGSNDDTNNDDMTFSSLKKFVLHNMIGIIIFNPILIVIINNIIINIITIRINITTIRIHNVIITS